MLTLPIETATNSWNEFTHELLTRNADPGVTLLLMVTMMLTGISKSGRRSAVAITRVSAAELPNVHQSGTSAGIRNMVLNPLRKTARDPLGERALHDYT